MGSKMLVWTCESTGSVGPCNVGAGNNMTRSFDSLRVVGDQVLYHLGAMSPCLCWFLNRLGA